ncbi:MAG: 3-deoxy-manno-octulosonate cytidylyltransferase [Verrucomicrobia bacterium]|nr:3-deoxy-manno-octulosonate cytidylyltransferase [Verrucomicrobiota bacterium]
MLENKRVACIIPARLKSTRFPRKMLASLGGKPLLQRVYERASSVRCFDEIAFAVDSEEVRDLVHGFGGRVLMTSESCPSGTDRLVEVMQSGQVDADIWVNWQGDEPFIGEAMIQDLLQSCAIEPSDVWTLKKRIIDPSEVGNPHIAKLVCDQRGFALYFSRSQIPYYRDETDFSRQEFYKHIGLYAFTKEALQKISQIPPCPLEKAEQLEQLRFLFNGLKIRVHETEHEVFGIDLLEHLARAEKIVHPV